MVYMHPLRKAMNSAIENLLKNYDLRTRDDYETAVKEVVQQLALLGFWRSKFFEHAAFYGGTALRLFFGLRRFSEDLDFSLISAKENFDFLPHLRAVESELAGFGFSFSIDKKGKPAHSNIESAFIKGNTRINLLRIDVPESIANRLESQRKIKIKIELDIDPPPGAQYEVNTLLTPMPFSVRMFSQPDLFAGKMLAVLCRQWKSRVKGRDFYDLVWFVAQKIPCRISHLKERMIQTGHWKKDLDLDSSKVLSLLDEKLNAVDFEQAKTDVLPFLRDKQELDLWSREFFFNLCNKIDFI